MGRATVRSAVTDWFAPPNVAGLNAVYTSQPKKIEGSEFFAAAGAGSGAVAYVYIEDEREIRTHVGGPTSGKKRVDYTVAIVVQFRSTKPKGEDAMADYDALLDAVHSRIRADRTFGSASLLQVGEGSFGVQMSHDLPRKDGETTVIWGAVRFQATEVLTT